MESTKPNTPFIDELREIFAKGTFINVTVPPTNENRLHSFQMILPIQGMTPGRVMTLLSDALDEKNRHTEQKYSHSYVVLLREGKQVYVEIYSPFNDEQLATKNETFYTKRNPVMEGQCFTSVRHLLGNDSYLKRSEITWFDTKNEVNFSLRSTLIDKKDQTLYLERMNKTVASLIQRNRKGALIEEQYDLRVRINESLDSGQSSCMINMDCTLFGASYVIGDTKRRPLICRVESMEQLRDALTQHRIILTKNYTSAPDYLIKKYTLTYIIEPTDTRWSYRKLYNNIELFLSTVSEDIDITANVREESLPASVIVTLYLHGPTKQDRESPRKDRHMGRLFRDKFVSAASHANSELIRLEQHPGDNNYHSIQVVVNDIPSANLNAMAVKISIDLLVQMNEIVIANAKLAAYYIHVNVIHHKNDTDTIEFIGILTPPSDLPFHGAITRGRNVVLSRFII